MFKMWEHREGFWSSEANIQSRKQTSKLLAKNLEQSNYWKLIDILLNRNLNNPLTNKDYNPDLFWIKNLCSYTNWIKFNQLSEFLSTQEWKEKLVKIINNQENLQFKENWIELISRASKIEEINFWTDFYKKLLNLIEQN